jgi:hypothetical protein
MLKTAATTSLKQAEFKKAAMVKTPSHTSMHGKNQESFNRVVGPRSERHYSGAEGQVKIKK